MKSIFKINKKGDLELDELGKLILGLILLIILIVIVMVYIKNDMSSQADNVKSIFSNLI